MFKKILEIFSGQGGILNGVLDVVDKFVTTKEEKATIKLTLQQYLHEKEIEVREMTLKEEANFNKRIRDLEGTASDLNQAGFFGRVILFFRGAQRPIWGFATMWFDVMYFNGNLEFSDKGENLLYIINVLVLGFVFGERAVKNILPLLKQFFDSKNNK